MEKAAVSALNKMGAKLRTAVSVAIRSRWNITKTDLDKYIRFTKARRGNYGIELWVGTRKFGLDHFGKIAQGKTGVSVEIIKGKPVEVRVKQIGTFIGRRAVGQLANVGAAAVFVRTSKGRLPVKRVMGPSFADLARSKLVSEAIRKTYDEEFPGLLSHEFQYYYSQIRQ